MSPRTDLVAELAEQVGPDLIIEDLANGWPSLATLRLDGADLALALFVSSIGRSHRDRDSIERRFQNSAGGTALRGVAGRESILVGLWNADDLIGIDRTVIAIADAGRRDDGRITRWSVFLMLSGLQEALSTGWASTVSDSGESILYLRPSLLPLAIMAVISGADVDEPSVYRAIVGIPLEYSDPEASGQDRVRLRRTVTSLVRDSRFRGAVLSAYARACAMCGLGLGLVQGAHIYPASAPESTDQTSNGLALCANHHLAFDRHLIGVLPDTFEIVLHPSIVQEGYSDNAVQAFVDSTYDVLAVPVADFAAPEPDAFLRRYGYFDRQYAWLGEL